MLNEKIPPHITVAAVESKNENQLINEMDKAIINIKCGAICWASIGIFNQM